jgi:NAD(P)-dependent dehydrogenase (short-subunit alcohol dehydrogenase family)
MQIEDSVALVTGGNRGIGEAFVRALLAAGARRVYVAARNPEDARRLAEEAPGRAIPLRLDVTKPDQIAAAAKACGDVSILINNAGAFHNQTLMGAADLTAARDEMEVNYFGPLQMCRAFAPALKANGGGAIVNVLSSGGLVAVPAMGGYSPSKFAGRAAATCLRAELAPQGTQVTALIVGSVDTRMAAHVGGHKERPEDIAKAGLNAIKRGIDELDTDLMALEVRASLARDPKALERSMAKMLTAASISTGR